MTIFQETATIIFGYLNSAKVGISTASFICVYQFKNTFFKEVTEIDFNSFTSICKGDVYVLVHLAENPG